MKTSNKWLLAALLVLLASLTAYNMGLRAEYANGAYKDPLRNTIALNFNNFSEVDVQAAHLMGVKLVAGPYSVRVNKDAAEYVKISQQGRRLTIALVFAKERESLGGRNVVTISLPQLRRLRAGATYSLAGKPATEKNGRGGVVRIEGFRQDSLLLRQDYATRLDLTGNELSHLRAEAGQRPGSTSTLRIARNNRIGAADLNLQSQSELELEAGGIARLGTQLGDSVKVTLTGAGLRSLGQRP